MPSPRFLSALCLLLLAAGRCTRPDGRVDARSVTGPVSRYPRTRTDAAVTEPGAKKLERRSHHGMEGDKDPHHKEKIITHLTGPLYFSPKCKKQFNRLYHSTRDCTIPAYYRRCAFLLIRLANSPQCAERCAVTHSYRRSGRCDNKEAEAS